MLTGFKTFDLIGTFSQLQLGWATLIIFSKLMDYALHCLPLVSITYHWDRPFKHSLDFDSKRWYAEKKASAIVAYLLFLSLATLLLSPLAFSLGFG